MRILSRTFAAAPALALVMAFAALPARAGIVGTSVFGELNFSGFTQNFFDPANGFVPPGSPNSSSPTVEIGAPGLGFAFEDGFSTFHVSFTADSFTLRFLPVPGGRGYRNAGDVILTDLSPGTFDGLTMISNTFHDVTFHLTGDTLQFNFGSQDLRGLGDSATFRVAGTSAPEPSSAALAGSCLLPLAWIVRRRRALRVDCRV